MNPLLFWLIALVALSVLGPVVRLAIAAVFGKQVGASALAKQPDTIHLQRRDATVWKNASAARRYSDPLLARGFEDAGVHAVAEMPGLAIQLLAHGGDGFYAAIYEHPVAGVWIDLFSHFQDGTSFTLATSKTTGLNPRPGHVLVNAPGLAANDALEKALLERPKKWTQKVAVDRAVPVFENAYADSIAYRKQAGISRGEVMKVATRKVA